MLKVVDAGGNWLDQAAASLVPMHRGAADRAWLIKRASGSVASIFDGLEPEPGHALIHLIAMGASDRYGCNRNGDYFFKSARKLELPSPDWDAVTCADGSIDRRDFNTFKTATEKGLLDTHGTFETLARVFRDHRNRPERGDKVHGSVKRSVYNADMERVELAVSVPVAEWRDDLQKIASGEQVPWSMACVADPDCPVLTSAGYKPISRVTGGDMVMTARGRWRRVTAALSRRYTGKLVRVAVHGAPGELLLTADHPVMAVPNVAAELRKPEWVHAGHLTTRHGLLEVAYLNGAEERWPDAATSVVTEVGAVLLGFAASGQALGPLEAAFATEFPAGIALSLPETLRAAFIAGVLEGSDEPDEGEPDCDQLGPGVGVALALKLPSLSHALAIGAVLSSVGVDYAIADASVAPRVVLHVAESVGPLCQQWSSIAAQLVRAGARERPVDGGSDAFAVRPVSAVSTVDVRDHVVYNLEVADDHTYVLRGIVSHNCHIPFDICNECGHAAARRAKYCSHLARDMTKLTKAGNQVGAVNDGMAFFDISRVHRPADRIAYALAKAAADATGSPDPVADEYVAAVREREAIYASPDATSAAMWIGKMARFGEPSAAMVKAAAASARLADGAGWAPTAGLHGAELRALAAGDAVLPFREFARSAFPRGDERLSAAVAEAELWAHKAASALSPEGRDRAALDSQNYRCASYPCPPGAALSRVIDALDSTRAVARLASDVAAPALEKRAALAGRPSDGALALLEAYCAYKAAAAVDISRLHGAAAASQAVQLSTVIDLVRTSV